MGPNTAWWPGNLMNAFLRICIAFLTLFLIVLPIFAMPVASDRIGPNTAQRDSVSAFDPTFPRGQWVTKREETRFYLHSTAPVGDRDVATWDPATDGGWPGNGVTSQGGKQIYLDTQRPLDTWHSGFDSEFVTDTAKRLVVNNDGASTATFNFLGWDPALAATTKLGDMQNMTVYSMSAEIWVYFPDYQAASGGFAPAIQVDLWEQNSTTGARTRLVTTVTLEHGDVNLVSREGFIPYRGQQTFDNVDGFFVARNHHLSVDVYSGALLGVGDHPVEIGFDTREVASWIQLRADSARLNYWTSNADGSVTTTFPSGRISQTEDTRIRFHLVHANMWGNQDLRTPSYVFNPGGHGSDPPGNWCVAAVEEPTDRCQWDNIYEDGFQLRLQDAVGGRYMPVNLGGGLQGSDPGQNETTAFCCNNEHHRITYRALNRTGLSGAAYFSYEFPYNRTFADGPYFVEFRDSFVAPTDWIVQHLVHIGGVGFELVPAPAEQLFLTYAIDPDTGLELVPRQLVEVNHTIFVGERTDYHVVLRNLGTTSDTFGLAVPTPGNGWTATVHPTTVTLPAGGEQAVTVQVAPPASGPAALPGFWKAVNLVASSLRSDDMRSLRLNTTLTSEIQWGVRLFSSEGLVEAQPLVAKVFPVSLINLATKSDHFVITGTGLPSSWGVRISPAHVGAYPKSMQDFTVTVTAPVEARGGDSHTLFLRATRIADSLVFGELQIDVSAVIRDGLLMEAYNTDLRVWRDVGNSVFRCENQLSAAAPTCKQGTAAFRRYDDVHFDDSAIWRYKLTNTGDREDLFNISASWVPPVFPGSTHPFGVPLGRDATNCEWPDGSPPAERDGVPDGWRYRIIPTSSVTNPIVPTMLGPGFAQLGSNTGTHPDHGTRAPVTTANAFSGDMKVAQIRVPPHTSVEFYVEMMWLDTNRDTARDGGCISEASTGAGGFVGGSGCANCVNTFVTLRGDDPSPTAGLRMTTRSTNDPTLLDVRTLVADIRPGSGVAIRDQQPFIYRHAAAINNVSIEPQLGQAELIRIPENQTGTYRVRGVNTGNEVDTIRFVITDEAPRWTHSFSTWRIVGQGLPGYQVTDRNGLYGDAANPDQNPRCQLQGIKELLCIDIGVYDEVLVNITATPPIGAPINTLDYIKVALSGGFQSTVAVSDSLFLEGIIGGAFRFKEVELDAVKEAYPGDVVAFPFSIINQGFEADLYQITLEDGINGDPTWSPLLSSPPVVGVPGLKSHHGFLSIVVPQNAPASQAGELKPFTLIVRSLTGGNQVERLEFFAKIHDDASEDLYMESLPTTAVQGRITRVNVTVRDPTDSVPLRQPVTLRIENKTLPAGWELVCQGNPPQAAPTACNGGFADATLDLRLFSGTGTPQKQAVGQFFLRVPDDELSESRTALRVRANTTTAVLYHDVEINLATQYGLRIDTLEGLDLFPESHIQTVAPGEVAVHTIVVSNTGLSPTTVVLTDTPLPQGWGGPAYSLPAFQLLPGQSEKVDVAVQAPPRGIVGQEAAIRIFANAAQDTTRTASLTLVTRIGQYELRLVGSNATNYIGPQESALFQIGIVNDGTVDDQVDVRLTIPVAYRGITRVEWIGCPQPILNASACLLPNLRVDQARQLVAKVTMSGDPLPGGTVIPITVTARSAGAPAEAMAIDTLTLRMEMLHHRAVDVDNDGIDEYGIDRNRDPEDGFEEFREALLPDDNRTGIETITPDLARFLTDNAVSRRTITVQTEDGPITGVFLVTDGDDDGQWDHLLDVDANNLPDVYFDPDRRLATRITVTRDVASDLLQDDASARLRVDGVPEYFIDNDGDGRLDVFYEITSGSFGRLIQQPVDADAFIDYIVDVNGNGIGDNNEPILFGGPAGIVRSLVKADVDGDGKLDSVFDADGDGRPDYFIPHGSTRRFAITLGNVDKDATLEWLFDADGDGRADSYYDPDTGKAQRIDARSGFVRDLAKFWYVGAIFALVLVLFIVLVGVTRR